MFCFVIQMQYTMEKEFQFLTVTKQTNCMNFCKIAGTLSEDSDQPAYPHSLISLCTLLSGLYIRADHETGVQPKKEKNESLT